MIREQEKQFSCCILDLRGILVKDLKGIMERREGNNSDGIMSRKGTYMRNFEEDNVEDLCMKISLGWSEQILFLVCIHCIRKELKWL